VPFHDASYEGEPDARAVLGAGGLQPLEDLKNPALVLHFKAQAIIDDREDPFAALSLGPDIDPGRLLPSKPDRVLDEISKDAGDLDGISPHDRQCPSRDFGAGFPAGTFEPGQDPGEHGRRIDHVDVIPRASGPEDREQVVEELLHASRAVDDMRDVLVGALVGAALIALRKELREANDDAQRLLQVM
jgi:hypothetical protein